MRCDRHAYCLYRVTILVSVHLLMAIGCIDSPNLRGNPIRHWMRAQTGSYQKIIAAQ